MKRGLLLAMFIALAACHKPQAEKHADVDAIAAALDKARADADALLEKNKASAEPPQWKRDSDRRQIEAQIQLEHRESVMRNNALLIDAQERLDLATIQGRTDMEDYEKERAKFSAKQYYEMLRERNDGGAPIVFGSQTVTAK